MKFEQVMDKDAAKDYIEKMAEQLDIDLVDFNVRQKTDDEIKLEADLLEGVMAGLIYFDEEKKCMVQKLTKNIVSGDYERDHLYYKYKFKVRDARKLKEQGLEASLEMLTKVCDVPRAIVNEMHGRNLDFAFAGMNFFLK